MCYVSHTQTVPLRMVILASLAAGGISHEIWKSRNQQLPVEASVLVRVCLAGIKHHNQRQLGVGRVYFIFHHPGNSSKKDSRSRR